MHEMQKAREVLPMSEHISPKRKQMMLIHIEREMDNALRNNGLCTPSDVKRVAKTIMSRIEFELAQEFG